MRLLATCISSSERCLFRSFPCFLIGLFVLFNNLFVRTKRDFVKLNQASATIFTRGEETYLKEQVLKRKLDALKKEFLTVQTELNDKNKKFDVILSHTCPFKYEPVETFLPGIDQSTVDTSTEEWLDKIEALADYKAWYCGHWHIDKRIDKIHFLFHGFESSQDLEIYG